MDTASGVPGSADQISSGWVSRCRREMSHGHNKLINTAADVSPALGTEMGLQERRPGLLNIYIDTTFGID